ncbi:hypothetical protein KAJ27_16505 [bacterium]|nr:hypothetical protein [bacterium]
MKNNTNFPLVIIGEIFNKMGYPEKHGMIFKKDVINKYNIRIGLETLALYGSAIGSVDLKLSLRILSDLWLGKTWKSGESIDIFYRYNPEGILMIRNDKPFWEVLTDYSEGIQKGEDFQEWKTLFEEDFQYLLFVTFAKSIIWGILYFRSAKAKYEKIINDPKYVNDSRHFQYLPGNYKSYPEFSKWGESCQKIAKEFEKNERALSNIPNAIAELPLFAESLGREVKKDSKFVDKGYQTEVCWWLYDDEKKINKRYNEHSIIDFIKKNIIKSDTKMIFSDGEEWVNASTFPEFKELF